MNNDSFFEARERLVEALNAFKTECGSQSVDFDEEVGDIMAEMEV